MQETTLDVEDLDRTKSRKNVFSSDRLLQQPTLDLPPSFKPNAKNQSDGLVFLEQPAGIRLSALHLRSAI